METIKEANKFSFGLGIFLFLTFGYTILLTGFEIKATLGFLVGIYNIWQQGFVNDASKWTVKPKLILLISVIVLLSAYGVLKIMKANNSQKQNLTSKEIFEEVEKLAKKELPKALGNNGDSIINILAINENTLEYLYKYNSKISEMDSSTLKSFESHTRILLKGNMNRKNPEILNEYRRNKLIFRHKFVDVDGNIISVIELNESDY
jgi:hypothetical protein